MIRIIGVSADATMAANIGGPVHITHHTFDIDCEELETWLVAQGGYIQHSVQGVAIMPAPSESEDEVDDSDIPY